MKAKAVMDVQKTLDAIDFGKLNDRVLKKHAKFVDMMDRIRAKSLEAAGNHVLR